MASNTGQLTPQQYQALSQILFSQIAPQVGLENLATNAAQGQAALIPSQTQAQLGLATAEYQNQLANLGLSQQGLAGQQQYLGTQEAIAPQQYALTQQGLQEQLAQLAYNYPLQVQAQNASAAASGAVNTVGNQTALQSLAKYSGPGGWNQQDIQRAMTQAGLSNQLQNAGFALQNLQTGLPGQNSLAQQSLGLQQQLAGQQYGYGQQSTQLQGLMDYLGAQQNVYGQQANTVGQILQNQAPLGLLSSAVSGSSNQGN